MGVEDIAGDLELALVEPDPMSVFAGQAKAESMADPKSDVVTNDCARGRHREVRPRRKVVGVPGVGTGGDEGCLARNVNPQALHGDKNEDC